MAAFLCKARDAAGNLVTEHLEAPTPLEAAGILERRGYLPISITPEAAGQVAAAREAGRTKPGGRPNRKELCLSIRQLATLVKAGVVIHEALVTVAAQCQSPSLRETFLDVAQEVTHGTALSKAMGRHPKVFDRIFLNAIDAGQLSGKLDLVLTRLAAYIEVSLKRRDGVKSALRYPLIVLVFCTGAFFFLVRFVVPKFVSMFARLKTELPLPTRILINTHKAITTYGWITGLCVLALVVGITLFLRSRFGGRLWDRLKLTIPLAGPLYTKSAISTFVQTFNTLNEAGVPILQTLETSAQSIGNAELEARLQETRHGVERGEPLSAQLQKIPQFPPLVGQMFAVGEKSGRMSEILDPLVAHYDMETQQAIEGLTAAIEPMITVLMGVVILFMALGIMLPSLSLMKAIK